MRRYIFNPAIGLSAFAFGLFVVYSLCFKKNEVAVVTQTVEINQPEIRKQDFQNNDSLSEEEPIDEETAGFEVIKPTIKKWLSGARIRSEFTDVSDESIKEITGKERAELDESEVRWFSYLGYEPTLIDVDGDGKKELAVRNDCAPVGNCRFWLLKKKGDSYEVLLSAGAVQMFKLKTNKTNGYFDLETKSHGDAWSGGIEIYKFDGEKYQLSECFNYSYSYLKDGKLYETKKPKITQRECEKE